MRVLYGIAIFLGAFLLFAVEPMAAKRLLPALGGSSAVWITCLVFFQTLLLLGYIYAHALTRSIAARWPAVLHVVLLGLAVLLLVLVPLPDLSTASTHPVTAIFCALSVSIGLPFLLLASTSPLLQVWMARRQTGSIPWRLFALSNTGSLLALLAYPSLIEPQLSLHAQRIVWRSAFAVYAVICMTIAARNRQATPVQDAQPDAEPAPSSSFRLRLLWFVLPAVAAMQLCSVTEYLTQNVAAIPLLWVIPLAVYLVSFIVAFELPGVYRRTMVVRLLIVLLGAIAYMLRKADFGLPLVPALGLFIAELFVSCYFCHAEAYRLRPASRSQATLFYLFLAGGGAFGGIFTGIACPVLFQGNYDLGLSFLATAIAIPLTWPKREGKPQRLLWFGITAGMIAAVAMMHVAYARDTVLMERNFYGALRVRQSQFPPQGGTVRMLAYGIINHGTQWFAPGSERIPTTYYAPDSGVGLALNLCCGNRPRNIGVVGLGAGTIAAYGRPGDRITFYEINPAVPPIAQHLFTYLRDSGAQIRIVPGDGRLSLAGEPPQHYDVLAIDAFSGDAIPMHLLTAQAMQIYRRQLAPGGVLVFNVSNLFVDLAPEVALLARDNGMSARFIPTAGNDARGEFPAEWVVASTDSELLNAPQILNAAQAIPPRPDLYVWTDDRSSLLPVLRPQAGVMAILRGGR